MSTTCPTKVGSVNIDHYFTLQKLESLAKGFLIQAAYPGTSRDYAIPRFEALPREVSSKEHVYRKSDIMLVGEGGYFAIYTNSEYPDYMPEISLPYEVAASR